MLIIENNGNDKIEMLKYAIENKYSITFWYRGVQVTDPNNKQYTKQNYRRVEPVYLGKSKKSGKWMLRAYQYSGTTNSKNDIWKTFLVDEIKDGSIQVIYDGSGEKLKTFDPTTRTYSDGRSGNPIPAAFKGATDSYINPGTYADVNKSPGSNDPKFAEPSFSKQVIKTISNEPTPDSNNNTPDLVEPNKELTKPEIKNKEPEIKITPDNQPEPEEDEINVEPDESDLETDDSELEWEPVMEKTSGYLSWLLNL
jgi:hypothetical protein